MCVVIVIRRLLKQYRSYDVSFLSFIGRGGDGVGGSVVVQQVKVLAAKPEKLNSTPSTYTIKEEN